jgi:tetrahydromethanopterin S-methyltransferase subunit C
MDYIRLISVLTEAASLIAAFAAIASAIIMARFIKKFATGILATGFKTIGIGIFILALGIIVDAININIQTLESPQILITLLVIKQVFFVVGSYIIVIGSKNMGDKLEMMSKHNSA